MSITEYYYPGGQPYTLPRDLTEEEKEQVIQYLESKGIHIKATDITR